MTFKDNPALTQQTILEAQWTDLPEEIVDEIRDLWSDRELGNDYYYLGFDVKQEKADQAGDDQWGSSTPHLIKYLEDHGVESCLIHWWW